MQNKKKSGVTILLYDRFLLHLTTKKHIMADFHFLDCKIVTDTINKIITLNFNTLSGTFTLVSASTSTIGTAKGISLKVDYRSLSGAPSSIAIDLKTLSLPAGTYSYIEIEITGTSKSPTPKFVMRDAMKL
jgi:hypothetical protein